jgi:hypothetical protein
MLKLEIRDFFLKIQFCDVPKLAIQRQGDLATFGYRPAMKV